MFDLYDMHLCFFFPFVKHPAKQTELYSCLWYSEVAGKPVQCWINRLVCCAVVGVLFFCVGGLWLQWFGTLFRHKSLVEFSFKKLYFLILCVIITIIYGVSILKNIMRWLLFNVWFVVQKTWHPSIFFRLSNSRSQVGGWSLSQGEKRSTGLSEG